jgi:hypothetical protein
MADFNVPFASNAGRRSPTADEKLNGFPCGPADQFLFNGLFNRLESEMRSVIIAAGITPSDTNMGQVRDAIQAMIDAATGGGDTSSYLLLDQAAARLPIYPTVESADGRINIISPAAGTVRIPGGVDFLHRGIKPITTVETDFATQPSKTYHVRWNPTSGYSLKDLADNSYNAGALAEANEVFDTTYDDMIMARVVTNSSNVATITTLANLSDLYLQQIIDGTTPIKASLNGANFLLQNTYNWSRKPKNFTLDVVKVNWTNGNDQDINVMAPVADRNNNVSSANTTVIPVDRYKLDGIIMYDVASTLKMNFGARA